jgi:predicted TIM-barrel fold metal-dependent hydrolase
MNNEDSKGILLENYRPRAKLVTQVTQVLRPRFTVFDAHNHLAEPFGGGWDARPVPELLDILDEAGVQCYVDLDGGWGEEVLNRHLDIFKVIAPERFRIFGGVDWSAWEKHGERFPEWAAGRLQVQAQRGAQGLKVWKPFGLQVRDPQGVLVRVDDPRLDPIWETAGELKLPVMIHVADPVAFFDPLDETNERWEELHAHPDWQFPSPPFPPFMSIMDGLAHLVARHANTIFIGAHVGCYAENLDWVAGLLERCPNFYIDISARIAEVGRQPYRARKFFSDYAGRILFGIDSGPHLPTYHLYYRFLESADEYFSYDEAETPPQGRWQIYGLNLPDEVLEKVYWKNAASLMPEG